jgi:hypothetical protein
MEALKNWAKANPAIAVAAALIVATIIFSLLFGSPDVPA